MNRFVDWPKIDLHRHVEGSMRTNTFIELAKACKLTLPSYEPEQVEQLIRLTPDDPKDFSGFIRTFTYLRQVLVSQEAVARIFQEAIEDAAKENIKYLELRFNPGAMLNNGMSHQELADGVKNGIAWGEKKTGINVGCIGIIGRDMPNELLQRSSDFCIRYAGNPIVGMDLAGNEINPPEPFRGYFERAKAAGLFVTSHAGEIAEPQNIIASVEVLGATRIGHGTRVLQDQKALDCLRTNRIMVECCLTSNIQTGAIDDIRNHPLPHLYRMGVPVSINTDDPAVSGGLTLAHEYELAVQTLGMSDQELQDIITRSVDYIFRPELKDEVKRQLIFPAG